ncbi:MAG: glycine cleavage system protein GcvH [Candidatus Gastranaerophilales bacterium]|nr:glycine cleavage system protein GcvH [Candidatus Gastranaerophilales bacterium]
MNVPEGILCTKSHEYIIQEDNVCTVGITDYAVEQLGDIVFVELPEVGTSFDKGESFGAIESVKAASEVYMPISGEITAINEALLEKPELINNDTYADGWLIKVAPASLDEDLVDALEYEDYQAEVE